MYDNSIVEQLDTQQDRTTIIFSGISPNKLACDTLLRSMVDGSWVMLMLGGGDFEPHVNNRIFISRSFDEGYHWSALELLALQLPEHKKAQAVVPTELMVRGEYCTLFFATHNGEFGHWECWMTASNDACQSWSPSLPLPHELAMNTFVRNHIITHDGRILLPFQHYLSIDETATTLPDGRRIQLPRNPRNGVLMSMDNGANWSMHGSIRSSEDDGYTGWAENNIVELADGTITMIIRVDNTGVLYNAHSVDGGYTWPERATPTSIPNPGSKATLYSLGGNSVALLHNPNATTRHPLALWISFDGMQSWSYQRTLVTLTGALNYPDGFVSTDRQFLHFAFDHNRDSAIYYRAKLPALGGKVG